MLIANPLTRQVANSNPEGCNQFTGKGCSYSQERFDRAAKRLSEHLKMPRTPKVTLKDHKYLGQVTESNDAIISTRFPDLTEDDQLETLAHEIAHLKLGDKWAIQGHSEKHIALTRALQELLRKERL